jgi:hypothetical protein
MLSVVEAFEASGIILNLVATLHSALAFFQDLYPVIERIIKRKYNPAMA